MPDNSPITVIRSKLYRPIIANDVIERRRLLELASAADGNSVTLVSAQAGCGKSTLVRQWLTDSGVKSAWLSLDPGDGNLPQFLTYIIAAIQTVFPDSCQEISEYLQMTSASSPQELAGALINDLDKIDSRFTLVLDDYHHLGASTVHDFLDCLLRHPPQVLHLVLITRRDPPLSLHLLRAGGVLTEIRTQDLLFTEAESGTFIRQCLGNNVSQATISRLHEATDGWPVGIRLATLAAPGPGAIDSFAQEMRGDIREVRDYLLTEVLAQQPTPIRDGLLRTSFLDRFSAPLCGVLLDGSDDGSAPPSDRISGETFLHNIRESGLLNIALDDKQEWYRYHHLFQTMLQSQAIDELGEAAITDIHLQASAWFEEQGQIEEAVRHMIAGDRAVAAGEVIVRHRNRIMNLEQLHHIEPWFELLPPGIIEKSPALMIVRARIRQTTGTLDEAWRILDEVDRILELQEFDPRKRRELKGSVESLRTYQHYTQSNGSRAVKSANYALQHLPADCFAERGFALTLLGGSLQMTGCSDLAKSTLYDALAQDLPSEFERKNQRIRVFTSLSFVHWINADLNGLKSTAKELADSDGIQELEDSFVISCFLQAIANYHDEDLRAAASVLEKIRQHKPVSNILFSTQCVFISALALQGQNQPEDASNLARFALEFSLRHQNKPMIMLAEAFQAELAMRQGRFSEALAWAQTFEPGPFVPIYEFFSPLITWAKVLVADEAAANHSRALNFLNEFVSYLEGIHNKRSLIEVLAIRAMLFAAMGNREAGMHDLSAAIALALPGRFVRLFVDFGPGLASLLSSLNLDEESLVYVGEILAAFRRVGNCDDPQLRSRAVTFVDNQSVVDPLSKREQQVLTLLAGRLSNKEIADQLNISMVTVKRHAANIYEKLDVHDRRKAVAKATGLGLIRNVDVS